MTREGVEVGGDVRAHGHVVTAGLECRVLLLSRAAPGNIVTREEVLEETQARRMDIGVDDVALQTHDIDDEHMGIGGPDLVLQNQLAVRFGSGRAQAGVIELERLGAMQTRHEGRNQLASLLRELEDSGAIQVLGGDLGLEMVERLVQVHDQQVHAVATAAITVGEPIDERAADAIPDGPVGGERIETPREALAAWAFKGLDHLGHGLTHHAVDPLGSANEEGIALEPASFGDNGVEGGLVDAGGNALAVEVGRHAIPLQRLGAGELEQGKQILGAVIGRQRTLDQTR